MSTTVSTIVPGAETLQRPSAKASLGKALVKPWEGLGKALVNKTAWLRTLRSEQEAGQLSRLLCARWALMTLFTEAVAKQARNASVSLPVGHKPRGDPISHHGPKAILLPALSGGTRTAARFTDQIHGGNPIHPRPSPTTMSWPCHTGFQDLAMMLHNFSASPLYNLSAQMLVIYALSAVFIYLYMRD
ncbi:hypothetical protein CDD82_3253 [Ophiocordyceps australis]|uniref:Uncharacterized protein n=1 Tax=Ophiocordyceps australis TaxID=1399860 RepID=A0A2C5ZEA8_9HYPO|nr:hypothetical protein CDD82_3253 [Ophiocordyceps australis]